MPILTLCCLEQVVGGSPAIRSAEHLHHIGGE